MDLELDWISLTKLDNPFDEIDLASVGVSIKHSFEMSVVTIDISSMKRRRRNWS